MKAAKLGRYQLAHELAASYLGPLWVARVDGAESQLALVRVVSLAHLDADTRVRLLEAAWQAMEVRGDHVAPVTDVVASDGELAVVCDHVEGLPLRAVQGLSSVRRKPMPTGVALRIATDLVDAATALHRTTAELGEEAVPLYGGLSPDSVLVGTHGVTFVLDVAIASVAATAESLGGNPERMAYAAPEQLSPTPSADARSDVFTAGVLVWELLANRRLFIGNDRAVAQKVLTAKIPRLDEARRKGDPEVPAAIVEIVSKALERDPAQRFASAEEFSQALAAAGVTTASAAEVAEYVGLVGEGALARTRDALKEDRPARPAPPVLKPAPAVAIGKPKAVEAPIKMPAPRAPGAPRPPQIVRPPTPETKHAPTATAGAKVALPAAAKADPAGASPRPRQPTIVGVAPPSGAELDAAALALHAGVERRDDLATIPAPANAIAPAPKPAAFTRALVEASSPPVADTLPEERLAPHAVARALADERGASAPGTAIAPQALDALADARPAAWEQPAPPAPPRTSASDFDETTGQYDAHELLQVALGGTVERRPGSSSDLLVEPETRPREVPAAPAPAVAPPPVAAAGGWLDEPASAPPSTPFLDDAPASSVPFLDDVEPTTAPAVEPRQAVPARAAPVKEAPSPAREAPVAPTPKTARAVEPAAARPAFSVPPPAAPYVPSQIPPPLIHDPRANRPRGASTTTAGSPAPTFNRGVILGVVVSLLLVVGSAAVAIMALRSRKPEPVLSTTPVVATPAVTAEPVPAPTSPPAPPAESAAPAAATGAAPAPSTSPAAVPAPAESAPAAPAPAPAAAPAPAPRPAGASRPAKRTTKKRRFTPDDI